MRLIQHEMNLILLSWSRAWHVQLCSILTTHLLLVYGQPCAVSHPIMGLDNVLMTVGLWIEGLVLPSSLFWLLYSSPFYYTLHLLCFQRFSFCKRFGCLRGHCQCRIWTFALIKPPDGAEMFAEMRSLKI